MNHDFLIKRRRLLKIGANLLSLSAILPMEIAQSSLLSSSPPKKLITIGGDIGEIVMALGGMQNAHYQLIATDITCTYPPILKNLPKVGYMRALSTEGILSLKPTLILASAEAGPDYVLQQIRQTKVPLMTLPESFNVENIFKKITLIADSLALSVQKKQLIQTLNDEWVRAQNKIRQQPLQLNGKPPKVLFILNHSGSQALISGKSTAADAMIRYVGATNAIQGFNRYKPMTAEAIIAAAPDVILTVEDSLTSMGGVNGLLSHSGFSLTPAGRVKRVIAMDSLFLLGFGPRFAQAVLFLHQQLAQSLSR